MIQFNIYSRLIAILFLILIFGCDSDNSVDPEPLNSVITGSVNYLDGSIGAYSSLQLRKQSSSLLLYTSADESGIYRFDSLSSGDYVLRFRSNNEDIHSYELEISLSENQTYEQDLYVLYKKIDEFNAIKKNEKVFLIKFQPEGGKIGNNFQFVDYLGGTFIGDDANIYTLSADIYRTPDSLDWSSPDSLFTPEYVKMNYELITSIDETFSNSFHEIKFSGEDIPKIISDPKNGFIFVRKEEDDRELMIPCVDMVNNDYGLLIHYQF